MSEDEIAAEFRRALERAIRRRRRAAFLRGFVDGLTLGPVRRWLARKLGEA